MLRSSRGGKVSRRIVIAVAAALVPLIAGCEAGNNAPTLSWHQPTPGSHATVGNISISNVFVLGAPVGAVLRPGQNAGVFLGLVNTGSPDQLISVSAPGVAQSVRLPGGVVPLRSQQPVLLTGPRPQVILEHLLRPLTGGSAITVYLRFAKAGTVKMQIPVMPRAQYYATLLPAPAPTRSHPARPPRPASASPRPSPTSSK
ncbi:MAG: copper chaperone PCu(A)C [Streptosporangiaceae bacterium]